MKHTLKGHYLHDELLTSNPVIVDAGACQGEYAEAVKKVIATCRIFCIECCGRNIDALKRLPYVTVVPSAIVGTKTADKMMFTEYDGLREWGNLYDAYPTNREGKQRPRKSYEVSVIGINELHKVLGVDFIDVLKMDVEGAELDILNSMTPETASIIGQISLEEHWTPSANWKGIERGYLAKRLEQLGFSVRDARDSQKGSADDEISAVNVALESKSCRK